MTDTAALLGSDASEPVSLADVLALLGEVQADVRALRGDVRELSRRIELLCPEEVLIDKARDAARANTLHGDLLRMALNDLHLRYNAFNLNTVRRLARGHA